MQGYGFVHSEGHKRPIMNKDIDTKKYAPANVIHTSRAKGSANEKKLGGAFVGFLKRILIPVV